MEYLSKSEYEELLKEFVKRNEKKIIAHMMKFMGYDDIELLKQDEYQSKWGLDCGWYLMYPKDREVYKEQKEADDYFGKIFCTVAYNTQSTTLQEVQIKYILDEMGIADLFYLHCHLD